MFSTPVGNLEEIPTLQYSYIVWAQNIKTVRTLIILQRKTLWIMNFKDQLFHSSALFSSYNILKFGDKITLENILFICKSINRQLPSIFYDWFTFSGNLHRYETFWSVTNHLKEIVKWTEPYKCVVLLVSRILWYKRINPSLKVWRFWYLILTGNFTP